MDHDERIRKFEEIGYKTDIVDIDDPRKGILILDVDNIDIFQERIRDYRVEADEPRRYLEK